MTDYIVNPLRELCCIETWFNIIAVGLLCLLPIVFGG